MPNIVPARSNGKLVVCVTEARRQLARAQTFVEVKSICDKAQAAKAYARACGDAEDAERSASLVVLWCQRRMGEILEEVVKRGRPKDKGPHCGPLLKDMGLTKQRACDFRRFAEMSEEEFRHVAERELSSRGVLRVLRKRAAEERERAAIEKSGQSHEWRVTDDQAVVGCEALVTDPPYGILDEPWEPADLERFTREWASRWNGCGADLLAVFFSQRHLWDGRLWFDESFSDYSFQQLLVWHYPNNKSPQDRMGFKRTWEPIFLYRRNGAERKIGADRAAEWGKDLHEFDCHCAVVPQSNFNDAERKVHPAQKPVSVFRWLVNAMTARGELVADPFAGSGTCGIAARQLGRGFYGIETDAVYAGKARERIAAYGSV